MAESSDGTLTVWAAQDESAIVVGLLFQAIRHGAAVLHSSGFVFREKAILVVGESGAGKSTLATLLADCPLLSDEFNIVERRDKDLIASATPLRSSSPRLPSRLSAPIGFVLFPVKDTRDFLVRLEPSLALARLGPHAVIPGFTEQRPPFALLASIAREVPAFEFHFRKDPSCRRLLDELPLP